MNGKGISHHEKGDSSYKKRGDLSSIMCYNEEESRTGY